MRRLPPVHGAAGELLRAGGLPADGLPGARGRGGPAGGLAERRRHLHRGRDLPLRAPRARSAGRGERGGPGGREGGGRGQDRQRQVDTGVPALPPGRVAGRRPPRRRARAAGRRGPRGPAALHRAPSRGPGAPGARMVRLQPPAPGQCGGHGRGDLGGAGAVRPRRAADHPRPDAPRGAGRAAGPLGPVRGAEAAPDGRAGPRAAPPGPGPGRVHGVPGPRVGGSAAGGDLAAVQGLHRPIRRAPAALRAGVRPDPRPRGGAGRRVRHAGEASGGSGRLLLYKLAARAV
mmetsp:Transcript_52394/g.162642  ORF Transcript_52394/g.162642 Transcript_52394/m.162642 type:complete len:289 (-) Transcript_52394:133-999(-)